MMQGYDLDDTLAGVDFAEAQTRGLARVFSQAKVLYVPRSEFTVITARPHGTAELRRATSAWLALNQPNWDKEIHYCEGTEAQIIAKKAETINRLGLTDFTDNNTDILRALAPLTTATLWRMTADGTRTRFNQ